MLRFNVKLPVIPQPPEGTRSVLQQDASNAPFSYFRGSGPASLLCGQCDFVLAERIGVGQLQNLVLHCPRCGSYNDTPFLPALEKLVSELAVSHDPRAQAAKLKAKVENARDEGLKPTEVAQAVQADSDALAQLVNLLEPKTAGDFYSMLGCIVAFLAFLATLRQLGQPAVVVNQYISSQAPKAVASRNKPCPCGSGRKFKQCHGSRSSRHG